MNVERRSFNKEVLTCALKFNQFKLLISINMTTISFEVVKEVVFSLRNFIKQC